MSYLINKFNGEELVVLQDGTVDITTSLGLVGRNYVGYGETQNENFVFLLENFSNDEPPSRPLTGQLWYDSDVEVLKLYNGNSWGAVGAASISETAPEDPQIGSLWIDTGVNALKIWSGTEWLFIGPEVAEGFGITRARSHVIVDDSGTSQPVILLTINDIIIGIIANSTFRISGVNDQSISGFLDIAPGINLSSAVNLNGNLIGLAERASILATKRTINGIGFDGSQDITITSNTSNSLNPGAYINGSVFNGSQQLTWEVDATSLNSIGKVVARDASGNFSANIISADIVGNLTGDINSPGTSTFNIVTATEFRGATLTGNAFTASKLRNPVTINQVEFDGSQDIIIPGPAERLVGDTIASNVKFSQLESVGILQSLRVSDSGITLGSGDELQLSVSGTAPGINSEQGTLEITSNNVGVVLLHSTISPSGRTTLSPNNINVDIGSSTASFSRIHASTFIGDLTGNADTSTSATTSVNLTGGGTGAIPYQTSPGTTTFVSPLSNKVLRSNGAGVPFWGDAVFASLNIGDYLVGDNYDGLNATTISVDATSTNVADKVVVRDSSGNFSAGTITADLTGTASQASSVYVNETGEPGGFFGGGDPDQNFNIVFQGEASSGDRFTDLQVDDGGLTFNPSNNTLSGVNLILDGRATDNVLKSGDTMTGFLTLNADPSNNLHAATKSYVDDTVEQQITALGPGLVRAFVRFDGSDLTIKNSLRVDSVQRISAGRYRINFSSGAFENENYVFSGMASDTDHFVAFRSSTVTEAEIWTVDNASGNNTPSNTGGDVMVTFFT